MAFTPVQSYSIDTSTTPARIALDISFNNAKPQIQIETKTEDACFILGGNDIVAVDTADGTTKALAAGNFILPASSVVLYDLLPTQTHLSVKALANTGKARITIGYGEKI